MICCLNTIKTMLYNIVRETVYERNGENLFLSIKDSGEVLNKLKSNVFFLASIVFTYDFSTLYTSCQII